MITKNEAILKSLQTFEEDYAEELKEIETFILDAIDRGDMACEVMQEFVKENIFDKNIQNQLKLYLNAKGYIVNHFINHPDATQWKYVISWGF